LLACLFQWFLFVLPSGTSPFSELAALTGQCFDLGVEAAVSDGLVLIQRHAEISKRGVIQGGAEEVSISFSSRSVVRAKGEIAGVGGKNRIFKSQGVCPITGPRVVAWIGHHRPQPPLYPKTSFPIDIEKIPAFPPQNWTAVSAELAHLAPIFCGSDLDPSLTRALGFALLKAALGRVGVDAVSREKRENGCGQQRAC
jgi:hypothetical protein